MALIDQLIDWLIDWLIDQGKVSRKDSIMIEKEREVELGAIFQVHHHHPMSRLQKTFL